MIEKTLTAINSRKRKKFLCLKRKDSIFLMNNICWLLIMERKDSYTLTLEALLQGLIPNATPPAVIRIIDLIHDLLPDIDAFGKWFDRQIRTNNLSLQDIDLVCMLYQFISYDFQTYMQKQYLEISPELMVHCDEEDSRFTNWQELLQWIEELEERNPKAWEDGFVQGMYAFSG